MIDTHTHLNFKVFADDWKAVANRTKTAGVDKIIVVGTDWESSLKAAVMAEENTDLYASVGIHPHHAKSLIDCDNYQEEIAALMTRLEKLLVFKKVVAIGEVGLDYHRYKLTKYTLNNSKQTLAKLDHLQKQLLENQVKLAAKYNKPLILHSRQAGERVLQVVLAESKKNDWQAKGVFHCFEGSEKYALRIIKSGFYLSFTGNITFDENRSQVASQVPLEHLLLETDSPLITPKPFRGKRNEPIYVKIIAQHHAESRKVQLIEVEIQTDKNACELFQL